MTLLLHLVRGDLRRLWLLLLAYILIVVLTTALEGFRPRVGSIRAQELLGLAGSLLDLARVLLLLLIVPMTIQLHPLVGTDAFWMTRPIPPRLLLAAKTAVLWCALALTPAIARGILMTAYGVPLDTLGLVTLEDVIERTLFLSLLMIGAALTPSVARFALLCGGAVVAAATLMLLTIAVAFVTTDLDAPGGGMQTADATGGVVFTLLTIAAAAALLAVQYRTRSRLRSIAAGLAGFAFAVLVSWVWPWPLLVTRMEPPAWARDASAATLAADPATVDVAPEHPSFNARRVWRTVNAGVIVERTPASWSGHPSLAEGALVVEGRTLLRTPVTPRATAILMGGSWWWDDAIRVATTQVLGVKTVAGVNWTPNPTVAVLFAADDEFARVAPITGRYEGRFHVSLRRHALDAVLPIRADAAYRDRSYRVSIEGISRTSSTVTIMLCESRASSSFDRRVPDEYRLYLRNRRTAEAVAGDFHPLFVPGLSTVLPFGFGVRSYGTSRGFVVQSQLVRFPATSGLATDSGLALTDEWLKDAEVAIVRSTHDGSVERPLVIEPFHLTTASRSAAAPAAGAPSR